MPLKFAQQHGARDRTTTSNTYVPPQPTILAAAEIPYKVGHTRPTLQQFPRSGSSTASTSNNAPYPPYRQRLVAAALAPAPADDPASSNDSSSAPSSNAVSSGVGSSSVTSSSSGSPTVSKGRGRGASQNIPPVPRISPSSSSIPTPTTDTPEYDPQTSYFEHLMECNTSAMSSPGPWYFEQRRMLWKTEPPNPPRPTSPAPSRVKLEALLSQAGAVESEEVWRAGLKNVWKGIVGGNQLRQRLPLDIVLKILQAGWLRDGTWPKGLTAPVWEQQSPPPPPLPAPPDDSSYTQQQRRYHEQEAYLAALQARAAAEQAGESAQMMYMQAYAMMGMGGIPPGYSPSSGDVPEEGYYFMPYGYAETTPPLPEGEAEGQQEEMERVEVPPPTPVKPAQDLESEMDTEDEVEEDDAAAAGRQMEGVVNTGDGRYEKR